MSGRAQRADTVSLLFFLLRVCNNSCSGDSISENSSQGKVLPRSLFPMGAPSGDHSGQEQRCCISSDAKGRTWISIPDFSHPVSIRPVPESFYCLDNVGSEDNGTATAQVGRAEILIPPSQKVENSKWFKWVCQPTSPISNRITVEGSRVSLGHHVSCRASESRPPGQLQFPSSNLRTGFTSGSSNQINPRALKTIAKY